MLLHLCGVGVCECYVCRRITPLRLISCGLTISLSVSLSSRFPRDQAYDRLTSAASSSKVPSAKRPALALDSAVVSADVLESSHALKHTTSPPAVPL